VKIWQVWCMEHCTTWLGCDNMHTAGICTLLTMKYHGIVEDWQAVLQVVNGVACCEALCHVSAARHMQR
jgi:hypothetical protein